jgi:two-component system alkaline phosphatase synthesis response regulator PhoP
MGVLVVLAEDDEDLGQVVKTKLENANLQVIWKKNGSDAWDAIVAEKPALAILDVDIPGINGIDLLDRIKKSQDTRHIRVIMLTALGHEAYVSSATRQGASDFIVKPFRTAEMLTRVQRVLGTP